MKINLTKGNLVLIAILFLVTSGCNVKDKDGNVKDIDGNIYKTIKINNQEWLAGNLIVSSFRNGDSITEAKTDEEWEKAGKEGKPAWCYINDPENKEKYGKLYNWYAVNDPRGMALAGWNIPTDAEWSQLVDFLGGGEVAGHKMKSTEGWTRNGNGTDEIGFSGFPGGSRAGNGSFGDSGGGTIGGWWSSTEVYTNYVWIRYLTNIDGRAYKDYYSKELGFSVRCMRD